MSHIRVVQTRILPNCRKVHGVDAALEVAIEHIRKGYKKAMGYPANEKAVFDLTLTLDRK